MLVERVERIADAKGKNTHEAVVLLNNDGDKKEVRCPFPDYSVGMEVEEEDGKYLVCGGKDLTEETVRILRDNGKFFYEVKGILSFDDIAGLCNRKSNMYELYKKNPFCLSSMERPGSSRMYATFSSIASIFTARTWSERLEEYRYAARYILENNENNGHTYIRYEDFEKQFLGLLNKSKHPMRVGSPGAILRFFDKEFFLEEPFTPDSKVAFLSTKKKEMEILNRILNTQNYNSLFVKYKPSNLNGLTDEQKKAVKESISCKGRIAILTGGPGTGKTTVLNKIVETMKRDYPAVEIRLMAPTGKAAKRMGEVMNGQDVEISTIHKFLGYGKEFVTKEDRDRIRASGLIIVDESSMVDLEIFYQLLEQIDLNKCKILLVGDVKQLPSIGAGNILHDLIQLNVPTFYLTKNHRSAGNIVSNADKIINGQFDLVEDEHFEIIDKNSSVGWYYAGISSLNRSMEDGSIISPYKTENINGSSFYINRLVQNGRQFGRTRYGKFCPGDNIIFVKTNYKKGYFNGETGTIVSYLAGTYTVKKGDVMVEVEDEEEMDLGYSMTIHKVQGSEYPTCDICIPKYTSFVTRRMLYTAVTRAKEHVRIFASKRTLRGIIMNNKDEERLTFLSAYAKEKLCS